MHTSRRNFLMGAAALSAAVVTPETVRAMTAMRTATDWGLATADVEADIAAAQRLRDLEKEREEHRQRREGESEARPVRPAQQPEPGPRREAESGDGNKGVVPEGTHPEARCSADLRHQVAPWLPAI